MLLMLGWCPSFKKAR